MAEGGFDAEMEYPLLGHDDEDDDGEEIDRNHPFMPTGRSTPGGEKFSFVTMHHEKSGFPDTSYEETSFGGVQSASDRSWAALTNWYPDASPTSLESFYDPKTGRLMVKITGSGKKAYELYTADPKTKKQHLNPKLTKEILKALGESTEDIVAQKTNEINEERRKLQETEKQLTEAERINEQKEKAVQEMQDVRTRLERTQARMDQLGSNVENESELRELEKRAKNYRADLENAKTEVAALEKQAK